ncbi:MAG: molybdopterin molybdotransferase MoeA [Deltaproteobacteria bacterium]|nr:molybdopterin molybdotransferase MoeA [Deltaproteobacteria bacterium]
MKHLIGFNEALDLTVSSVPLTEMETVPLEELTGRTLLEDIVAKVDSPSSNSSLRDGYAVRSMDLAGASKENPIQLDVAGRITAGTSSSQSVKWGQAVGITTGASMPHGADAVIMEENSSRHDKVVLCFNSVRPGENVFRKGADVRKGEVVLTKGELMTPARLGLMASAGFEKGMVRKAPRVAVIATGDEVVLPGNPLAEGQLYASNMVEICSWLSLYGISYRVEQVPDRKEEIQSAIVKQLPHVDAFITSGGAWGGERDLMMRVLDDLGWQGVYHKVKMKPGKGAGFGLLKGNPFFLLPGVPSANETAFTQLALPGLLAMGGCTRPPFLWVRARAGETIRGDKEWTQFFDARFTIGENGAMVQPIRQRSRLRTMAQKEALMVLPEGCEEVTEGEETNVQLLYPFGKRVRGWVFL